MLFLVALYQNGLQLTAGRRTNGVGFGTLRTHTFEPVVSQCDLMVIQFPCLKQKWYQATYNCVQCCHTAGASSKASYSKVIFFPENLDFKFKYETRASLLVL